MSTGKFGRYEIKSEIGRGGMATVFHAYDPRFERDVAIKVLPKEFLHDPQFRARFEREAKTIALLEHPAIVPVYDFGDEEGQPYIVMRYMSGGSMAERLAQGPMSLEETAQLYTRLAPALDAAHAKGIIHRDLKPGNVLFDQYGNSFLSDFGIARLAQQSGVTLTGGNILGTPAYMSPEQVQGDKEIDGRSDIYAMGVILFQMLTGNAPYQATTPARVMMMHILEPVPHILQVKPDVPAGIQGVIEKAMAKEPKDRFPNMAEMAGSLEMIINNATPSRLKPPTPTVLDATSVSASSTAVPPAAKTSVASLRTGGATQVKPDVRSAPTNISEALPLEAAPPRRKISPLLAAALAGVVVLAIIGIIGVVGVLFVYQPGQQTAVAKRITETAQALALTAKTLVPTSTKGVPPTNTPALATNTADAATPTSGTNSTAGPTDTVTPSPVPADTDTPTPSVAAVMGGGDKIAFLSNHDVWVVNVDGSSPTQLTTDGAAKTRLSWSPDGNAIFFISGKCIKSVTLEGRLDVLTCFDTAAFLEDFQISPDGKRVAVSIDHEQVYVVPYDQAKFAEVKYRRDLVPLADCPGFAPITPADIFKTLHWSADSQQIAVVMSVPSNNKRVDIIRTLDVSSCGPTAYRAGSDFPALFFTISGYDKSPIIQSFGWNSAGSLFALTGQIRNGGFGDLYFYHADKHQADLRINPIGSCCYRDPTFSPDGSYIAFAYQAISADNKIVLYYIRTGEIGSGTNFTPLPLGDSFFPLRDENIEPAVRPAK